MNKKRILPIGFYDLNAIEARKNYEYTKIAIENYLSRGYELIKTSIAEFVDNYDDKDTSNVFKIIDPISKKNIFFRNDITLQIAKYISSRSNLDFEVPLKLCYYGDIINLNSDELYCERQQTQVGCEIIGDNSLNSCYEVISDTLNILSNINNVSININLPDFLDIFLQQINLPSSDLLRNAIINKRISDINMLAGQYRLIIAELVINNSDFNSVSHNLKKLFDGKIVAQLNQAHELMEFLHKNFPNVKINFDLFGDDKFSYHNSIAFDVFSSNFPYPIAKGGCYSIAGVDKILNSVGSTIYINFLRKI